MYWLSVSGCPQSPTVKNKPSPLFLSQSYNFYKQHKDWPMRSTGKGKCLKCFTSLHYYQGPRCQKKSCYWLLVQYSKKNNTRELRLTHCLPALHLFFLFSFFLPALHLIYKVFFALALLCVITAVLVVVVFTAPPIGLEDTISSWKELSTDYSFGVSFITTVLTCL